MFQYSKRMSKLQVIDMLNHGLNWLKIAGIAPTVADAAQIINKAPRTLEAYRAKSDPRQIGADDLLKIFAEAIWTFSQLPADPIMPITVFDESGQPVVRVHSVHSAAFIADAKRGTGYYEINDGVYVPYYLRDLPERTRRKSRLRRLMFSKAVNCDQACKALECCEYALVAMMIDAPLVDVAAPDEKGLRVLEAMATAAMGEAA
ncbi:hypothetical protein ELI15_14275 [Rhizobium ruizarguesonis]|uniref:hypothetical protein n=1 Tax=Rhizobium ruizarguesonis TaxID=2081791 RepID=UPI0010318812|nr:hypothetical protein [Rhizobium ruizarguesonis]TAW65456.1 hypothetical protein ELI15_14275 [Rhizobium ruizarguesonis]